MHKRVVIQLAIAGLLLISIGTISAQSAADYSLTSDSAVDIPEREVTYDGETFVITETGVADPESEYTVTTTAPDGTDYLVRLVEDQETQRDIKEGTGSEEFTFDLDALNLDPGTYAIAIEKNENVTAAMPLVVRGYGVTQTVPDETAADTDTTVDISLDPVDETKSIDRVVLTVWDGSEEIDVTATETASNEYTATISSDQLSEGTYQVVSAVETGGDAFGRDELIGISSSTTLTVTEPQATETESGSTDGTSGGGGGGGGTGGGQVQSTATETATESTTTPEPTATQTATPTPTESTTTTQTDTETPNESTVTSTEPTASGSETPATTEADGGRFAKLLYAAIIGLSLVYITAQRREK